jgi:hypothetical protein
MEAVEEAEFLKSMRAKHTLQQLTAEGWATLMRALEREKTAEIDPPDPRKLAEDAAALPEVLSKRTWVQNVFARIGPRVRATRPRVR